MKERAKEYFEDNPDRTHVIVTTDGNKFHVEHRKQAANHARTIRGGIHFFERSEVMPKKKKKKK